jgi:transposase
MEPIWAQFSVLLPDHPVVAPTHPLGCHRPRLPDRLVFEQVVAALVPGSGYERIALAGCSDRTIRRRLRTWAERGLAETLHRLVLEQYDRMIGLELDEVAVDGCLTKAPGGGETAGRSPVDRGKQGLKRSPLTEATGVPLHLVAAGANRHDAPLRGPTLAGLEAVGPLPEEVTVHLDRGYDSGVSRAFLAALGLTGIIARRGVPAPLPAGRRWVVERTQSWMNDYGKMRRCPEKARSVVDFSLFLTAAIVVTRCLIQRARSRYRWPGRPTTRRLT